jgi:hypothetical protein
MLSDLVCFVSLFRAQTTLGGTSLEAGCVAMQAETMRVLEESIARHGGTDIVYALYCRVWS